MFFLSKAAFFSFFQNAKRFSDSPACIFTYFLSINFHFLVCVSLCPMYTLLTFVNLQKNLFVKFSLSSSSRYLPNLYFSLASYMFFLLTFMNRPVSCLLQAVHAILLFPESLQRLFLWFCWFFFSVWILSRICFVQFLFHYDTRLCFICFQNLCIKLLVKFRQFFLSSTTLPVIHSFRTSGAHFWS